MSSNSANFGLNNIVTSGSLGVNTYSPLYQLDVAGTGNINLLKINDQYTFPTGVGSVGDSLVYSGSNQIAWSGITGGGTHPTIAAASSSDNAGRTYIQDILLDSYGHVTGISTSTETVTDTTYSDGSGVLLDGNNVFHANVAATAQTTAPNSLSSTSNRTYSVQVDSNDKLVVNVPWVDTAVPLSGQMTGDIDMNSYSITGVAGADGINIDGDITANYFFGDLNGPIVVECKNSTGSTIEAGTPVYVSGYYSNNGKALISVAKANDSSKMPAIGLLESSLSNDTEGYVHCFGLANHLDASAFSVGQTVYVHPTGGLTDTRPTGVNELVQNIGRVLRSDSTQGKILVLGPGRTNDVPNSGHFEQLTVDGQTTLAKDGGNVGIGTATPAYKLDVNGTINSAKLEITNTSTDDSLLITTTEDSSTAAPVLTFKRNSSSPADGDYLGQLKFKGENDADQEVVYAKVTAKISDATDTTEDGLFEFALRKAGSNNIGMRLTSTSLNLLNGTEMDMGSQQIHSVVDPTSAQDAATKNYVDNNHITISAASSVDNSNGSVIQDITLDANGHVTGLGSIDLDSRYYTESEIDAFNYVDGNGTASYLPKWSDTDTLTNSVVYDDGTNIGIGTASPQAKLDVNGTVQFDDLVRWEYPDKALDTSISTLGYMRLYDEAGAYAGLGVSTSSFNVGTSGLINLRMVTNAIERAIIDTSGNITCNPLGLDSNFTALGLNDSELFHVDAGTDSVGIGTDNPASKLTVASTNEEGIRIHTVSSPSQNFIIGRNTSNGTLVFKGSQSDFSGYEFRSTIGGSSQTVLQTDRLTGALTLNNAFTFPTGDGTNSQVLATDGNGNVSWSGISDILSGFSDYEVLTTSKSTFTVNGGYTVGSLDVYYNGLKLIDGDDYTATNGTTFTLASAAGSADVIEWEGHRTAPEYATIGNPGNYRLAISDGSSTSLNAQSDLVYDTTGLGVGTSSPSYKLDVNGTFSANSINVNDVFTLPTTDGSNGQSLSTDGAGNVTWEHPKSSYIMSVMFG